LDIHTPATHHIPKLGLSKVGRMRDWRLPK
jgi:hypothetical protein